MYYNCNTIQKARKHHLMFVCPGHMAKGMISGRGQGILRFNHIFAITCKQTAGIVIVINSS